MITTVAGQQPVLRLTSSFLTDVSFTRNAQDHTAIAKAAMVKLHSFATSYSMCLYHKGVKTKIETWTLGMALLRKNLVTEALWHALL